ncbi:helix-turn-helix transcriptional regulator [Bacillus sp. UNC438CL73TsuS30]|uniref:helix-turn-helix transcriptional regulator n=1 Tax=Bacillus sp. UNC438CL73TsuS30 TaxID=1340434 RepID=UPI00047E77C4|nr:helix-turn-helix transcriptional regulator [Bacillus sp. UNC438CL73TsuS30]
MKNQLAKIRKEAKLTQEELAAAVGITRNYVSKIENGGVCSLKVLSAIAKKLNVKIDDIFLA